MKGVLKALVGGMILMLFIIGVTALGVMYPVPENYIVGHSISDYQQ